MEKDRARQLTERTRWTWLNEALSILRSGKGVRLEDGMLHSL